MYVFIKMGEVQMFLFKEITCLRVFDHFVELAFKGLSFYPFCKLNKQDF